MKEPPVYPLFPDLIRAVFSLADTAPNGSVSTQPGFPWAETPRADPRLSAALGDTPRKTVFVLVDGMGESILERLEPDSFLRRNRRATVSSVYPSTTACAMTAVATGLPPAIHGLLGRTSYIAERDLHANTLSFRTKNENVPLVSGEEKTVHGAPLSPDRFWPFPSLIPSLRIPAFTVIPRILLGSPFARYLCGLTPTAGYPSIAEAVDHLIAEERKLTDRGYLFFYLWDLDTRCHEVGPGHASSLALLTQIDGELARLRLCLDRETRLVITADHGQYDVADTDRQVLTPNHPAAELLATPPFGEPRAAQLLVKPGREELFSARFTEEFGEFFDLVPAASQEAARLFGAASFSPQAERNLGTFLCAARGRNLLLWADPPGSSPETRKAPHAGEHGGNLPEERLVPLVVA